MIKTMLAVTFVMGSHAIASHKDDLWSGGNPNRATRQKHQKKGYQKKEEIREETHESNTKKERYIDLQNQVIALAQVIAAYKEPEEEQKKIEFLSKELDGYNLKKNELINRNEFLEKDNKELADENFELKIRLKFLESGKQRKPYSKDEEYTDVFECLKENLNAPESTTIDDKKNDNKDAESINPTTENLSEEDENEFIDLI